MIQNFDKFTRICETAWVEKVAGFHLGFCHPVLMSPKTSLDSWNRWRGHRLCSPSHRRKSSGQFSEVLHEYWDKNNFANLLLSVFTGITKHLGQQKVMFWTFEILNFSLQKHWKCGSYLCYNFSWGRLRMIYLIDKVEGKLEANKYASLDKLWKFLQGPEKKFMFHVRPICSVYISNILSNTLICIGVYHHFVGVYRRGIFSLVWNYVVL